MPDPTQSPPILLGIDVGGTKIAGVAVEDLPHGPRILAQAQRPAQRGADALIEDIVAVVHALTTQLAEHPELAGPQAIGIGTPGSVDEASGDVRDIANLAIPYVPLAQTIREQCGLPTIVENDVNAAALGAARLIDGTQTGTIAFLNLGTGLAAGVLRDGAIDRGSSNTVGEIGHIPVEPHRWKCACGQRGCLETAASGGAAKRLWPYADWPMPAILAASANPDDPRHKQAEDVKAIIIGAIADAIDILAVTVDPAQIILGGGMAKTGSPLLEAISQELHERALESPFITSLQLPGRLRLAPANMPVGAIGAALCAERIPVPHNQST